ncbi:hypothetical protein BGZ98_005815 [Dissophora globulifera]|nr:hypothetical protein BGZ98_005815 [Dissophora globulifera]
MEHHPHQHHLKQEQDEPASLPLGRLPPECTHLVLQYLWDDIAALHRLLLCSREFFALVVPILYRDPFRLIDDHRTWTRASKSRRTAYLMRILSACAATKPGQYGLDAQALPHHDSSYAVGHHADQAQLLAPAAVEGSTTTSEIVPRSDLGSASSSSSSSPPTPPLLPTPPTTATRQSSLSLPSRASNLTFSASHLQDLATGVYLGPLPSPLTVDYLFYYTHQRQIPRSFHAFQLLSPNPKQRNIGPAFKQMITEASTTLAMELYGHFPSRIQVLSMTPSQLKRILFRDGSDGSSSKVGSHGVGALKMLRRLELNFGVTNTPTRTWDGRTHGGDGDNHGVDLVDIPLMFIKEHQKLFPSCPEDSLHDENQRRGIAAAAEGTLLQELVIRGAYEDWTPTAMLTKIEPLKVLDLSAWNADVPHLDQIPCSRLTSLRLSISRLLGRVEVPSWFLQQEKRVQLEEIWMPLQSADTFLWAIDLERSIGQFASETRLRRRRGLAPRNSAGAQQQEQQQQQRPTLTPVAFDPTRIPKMKKIHLSGHPQALIPSLEDAADAFRDTLEELVGCEDGIGPRDEYPRMTIDWLLPNITLLDLRGRFVEFFELRSLRQCPHLRVVRLFIESYMSSLVTESAGERVFHERQDFSVLTQLKWLEELQLRGSLWEIDDAVLDTLAGLRVTGSTVPTDSQDMNMDNNADSDSNSNDHVNEEPVSYLPRSLTYFDIAEQHQPTTAGLKRFVTTMEKLRVLHVGNNYAYAIDRLHAAAGERLVVDVNGSD